MLRAFAQHGSPSHLLLGAMKAVLYLVYVSLIAETLSRQTYSSSKVAVSHRQPGHRSAVYEHVCLGSQKGRKQWAPHPYLKTGTPLIVTARLAGFGCSSQTGNSGNRQSLHASESVMTSSNERLQPLPLSPV